MKQTMAKLKYRKMAPPPAGKQIYTLLKVEEVENRFYDPKKDSADRATQLEWNFVLDENPEITPRIWSTANLSVYKGKKSKCLQLVEALLDKTLNDTEKKEFEDTDGLIGKKCYLTIKHETTEDGSIVGKIIDYDTVAGLPY